jgi:hypothetical protein
MANHASHQINGKFVDCKKAENRRNQVGAGLQKGFKGVGKGAKGFTHLAPNIPQTRFTGIRPNNGFQVQRQPQPFPMQRGKFGPQFQPQQQFQFSNNIKGKGRGMPPPRTTGPADEAQIFIGGVTIDCPDETVVEYFSKWGEVSRIEMKTGKGFGFVTFTSAEPIEAIMANHESHTINGKFVDCKRAENRRTTAAAFVGKGSGKGSFAPIRQTNFGVVRTAPFA